MDEVFEAKRLYRFAEAAKPFDVAERTLRDWADRDLLRVIKLPSGRRILGSELNRFLAERES